MWGIPRREKPDGAGVTRGDESVAENLMRPMVALRIKTNPEKLQSPGRVTRGKRRGRDLEASIHSHLPSSRQEVGSLPYCTPYTPTAPPTHLLHPLHTRTLSAQELNLTTALPRRGTFW